MQKLVFFLSNVPEHANNDQQGSDNTQSMSEHAAWLEPVMIRMVKSLFKRSHVIRDAFIGEKRRRKTTMLVRIAM